MGKEDLFYVGKVSENMATIAKFKYTGDVYADPGLSVHINRNHSHELPQDVLKNPFRYIKDILNEPDLIGSNPKQGGIEMVKYYDHIKIRIQIGIKYDTNDKYMYVATLHPIEQRKIDKRIEKRLFYYRDPEKDIEATLINPDTKRGVTQVSEDKTQEIMEKLEKGIKETLESEKWKNFLQVQSQFHNYSFNNAMLIFLQRPDATRVAGFNTWKNKFERTVMRGEKGIGILAPVPYKYEKDVEILNKETGQKELQKKTVEGIRFKKVTVFDVKQTEGKELPEICRELQGNSISASQVVKAIKEVSDVPVVEKAIESGAKGYYSRMENIIAYKEGMSMDQNAKTLIHEYAHSQLHSTEASALLDRATKEVQAESVAYIVCNRFGIETSEYSFEYLASWSSGKDLKELKESFDLIQKTSNKIIEKIENAIQKDIALQSSPVKVELLWSESDRLLKEFEKIHGPIEFDLNLNWKPKKSIMMDFKEASQIIERLEKETIALKTVDGKYKIENPIGGNDGHLYEKTKFILHAPKYPPTEFRFDIGDGEYKNLFDCVRTECGIDVEKYYKDQAITQITHEKVQAQYIKEFPAVKYISEKTAKIIDNLNNYNGSPLTIDEIKDMYKAAGKKLEGSYSKSDMEDFKVLKEVVDDLKQAQLTLKQENAQQKASLMPEKTANMDLTR